MPKFSYTATDASGKEHEGSIEAANQSAAVAKLKEQKLFPSQVIEVSDSRAQNKSAGRKAASPTSRKKKKAAAKQINIQIPFLTNRINRKQMMVFTRQLATLIEAGVPLLRALQILQKQERTPGLYKLIGRLCDSVEGGTTFAEALAQNPKQFDRLFVNMVRAGEIGGMLEATLNRLAEFMEKAEKIKTKVRGAMVYPIVVLVMAMSVVAFLMIQIVPKFTEIFQGLIPGESLPPLTQFVVKVSDLFVNRAPLVVAVIVGVVVLFNLLGRTRFGRLQLDRFKLHAPIFGTLIMRVSISRFSRTLSTLLTSGVQILQSLNIVKDTLGNECMANAVQDVHDSVKEGETMADPLEASRVFPSMVVSMITVGEETGRVPEMLGKIADTYDGEVDAAVEGLTSIIEPILIVFLAVIVGTIVIAMFMPLVSIISNIQK